MTNKTFLCDPSIGGCGATFRDSEAITRPRVKKLACPVCKTSHGIVRTMRGAESESQSWKDGYRAGFKDAKAGWKSLQHWIPDRTRLGSRRNYTLGYKCGWTETTKAEKARKLIPAQANHCQSSPV